MDKGMNTQLVEVIETTELTKDQGLDLAKNFNPFFEQAAEWKKKAEGIVVTSDDQKKEMMLAREARLALADIRKQTEARRKEIKADALRFGKAVDGMANVIKFLIVPLEEHLKKQEDFTKIREAAMREKLISDRSERLESYGLDPAIYNLADMPQEIFNNIIEAAEAEKKAEEKRIKDAEIQRMKEEEERAKENERIKKENEKLRKEAEAREKAAKKEKAEQEEALRKEREAREKLEIEKQEKIAAEKKAQDEAKAKAKAEADAKAKAERDAALAPDKDKLVSWSKIISAIDLPVVESKEAKEVAMKATAMLLDVVAFVKKASVNL